MEIIYATFGKRMINIVTKKISLSYQRSTRIAWKYSAVLNKNKHISENKYYNEICTKAPT